MRPTFVTHGWIASTLVKSAQQQSSRRWAATVFGFSMSNCLRGGGGGNGYGMNAPKTRANQPTVAMSGGFKRWSGGRRRHWKFGGNQGRRMDPGPAAFASKISRRSSRMLGCWLCLGHLRTLSQLGKARANKVFSVKCCRACFRHEWSPVPTRVAGFLTWSVVDHGGQHAGYSQDFMDCGAHFFWIPALHPRWPQPME